MPEIAEIARAVHNLKRSIVGKTLTKVTAVDDANIFGKVGTSGAAVQKALSGKKVLDAGRQGKYFWLIMSSPPHPVFHFGMAGWFHIRGDKNGHYRQNGSEEDLDEEWPPKWSKLIMEAGDAAAAFTDKRRFARIRLVDCEAGEIRKTSPLKENGPDPVLDKDIFTPEYLEAKMRKKHVPIKALLLDQANISGIGNWVGDEVLYHAKFHPEQYSDTFTTPQIQQLHSSIYYVCSTAIDALADHDKFPEDWLMKYRWGKGKKDATNTLPNGAKITHITVGGRTSAIVPSVQKKTGPVAGEVKEEGSDGEGVGGKKGKAKSTKTKATAKKGMRAVKDETEDDDESAPEKVVKSKPAAKSKKAVKAVKAEEGETDSAPEVSEKKSTSNMSRKRKALDLPEEPEAKPKAPKKKSKNTTVATKTEVRSSVVNGEVVMNRRRSSRVVR